MAQEETGRPAREVNVMINAIIRAILDTSPPVSDPKKEVIGDRRVVRVDVATTALAYLIAAIGVQTKAVENRAATKAFVRQMADLIEGNIKTIRDSRDEMPFAKQIRMFRTDQRQ